MMRTAVECVNSSQVRYYIGDGDTKDVTFECQFLLGKVLQCVKEDIMNNKMRTAESVNSSQVRYYNQLVVSGKEGNDMKCQFLLGKVLP